MQRFKNGTFIEKQGTTIGVDFTMRTLVIDGKRIKLQIWDTGGQERFRTITQSYYRSANGIILCYDITCRQSFESSMRRWIDDVSKFAVPNVAKILIGKQRLSIMILALSSVFVLETCKANIRNCVTFYIPVTF